MKRDLRNEKKITPEQLMQIRLNNGEIKFIEERDETVWTKSKKEKAKLSKVKSSHKAMLKGAGLNPKKFMNIPLA